MRRGRIIIESNHIAIALSSDGTVWMTVEEIASIFHITGASVERHIKKLFAAGELDERKMRTEQRIVRNGRRYVVEYHTPIESTHLRARRSDDGLRNKSSEL